MYSSKKQLKVFFALYIFQACAQMTLKEIQSLKFFFFFFFFFLDYYGHEVSRNLIEVIIES